MKKNPEYMWFRLWRTRGIGPKTIAYTYNYLRENSIPILELTGSSQASLARKFPLLEKNVIARLNPKDKEDLVREYNEVKKAGLTIIHPDSEYYPKSYMNAVEQIGAPPLFFAKGNLSLLTNRGIAIVGSRNVSPEGLAFSKEIAAKLAENDGNIVSGYARGVDSAAHMGALEAEGTTTLVLSYGIDEFKIKKEFRDFDIEGKTLIVTQFMPKQRWSARGAMARNKLLCALSGAVVIIESGPEKDRKGRMSGTFDSARTALKMGNRLFVLSPSVLKEKPAGNDTIISLGGIEIFPADAPGNILKTPPQNQEYTGDEFITRGPLFIGEAAAAPGKGPVRPQPAL